jgi:electron transfer flavoprotein beta subunit
MRIVVLIKQILNPAGITVRRDLERIFVNVEEYIISPGDKNALEAALQIKDAAPETEVVAISLGPPRADDALREALAMGADAAYLLSDPTFEEVDVAGAARILAAAVRKLGAELVITGREAGDTAAGQIGPRLAELLDMAQITDVHALAVENGTVQATRRWGEGYAAVTAPLPAVVTVAPEVNKPRYPHGARIMNAYRQQEVPVWDAAELGLSAADLIPLTTFRGQSFPPPLEKGELLRGDPAEVARELVGILRLLPVISDQ